MTTQKSGDPEVGKQGGWWRDPLPPPKPALPPEVQGWLRKLATKLLGKSDGAMPGTAAGRKATGRENG